MGAGVIFIIVGIVFLLFVAWKSFHPSAPARSGSSPSGLRSAARRGQPDRVRGEAGYQRRC
jgi:hypothetical protein